MKAVRYRSYGDSGVLVYGDADRPVAGAGQVVVKVAGAAFNPVDVAIRAGSTPGPEAPGRGVRTARVFARSDAAQLAGLVARVDAGDLTIDVAQRRPLADLPAVHDQAAAGQLPGKTILTP